MEREKRGENPKKGGKRYERKKEIKGEKKKKVKEIRGGKEIMEGKNRKYDGERILGW